MKNEQVVMQEEVCYHCGDDLASSQLVMDNRAFCCAGCQSVYQLLNENKLCNYYNYHQAPGTRANLQTHYEYLDEESIVQQMIDYKDEKISIVTFYIPSIHCSSCIWLLEHLYKMDANIFYSRIDFVKKQVTIHFHHALITLRQLVEVLSQIGYEPAINLQDVVKEKGKAVNKSLILKIAIAGFSMGNVMLFSFPEYFGLSSLEIQFQQLFGWLNLAFSIPVTLYCARDYFISAYTSLKHGHVNLDTPLALIIAVLFLRTAFEIVFQTGPGFADTLTGLVFLLLMGKWIKQRTFYHISFDRDYRSYFPIAITTLKEGKEKPVAINDLAVGDRLWIRNGELIPADSVLIKGTGWLDMSFVTGETTAQHKLPGALIYAGGKQVGEGIEVEVIKPASQSYLTSLWNKEHYTARFKQGFNDRIAKYFSIMVFLIAFSSAGYWLYQDQSGKAWAAFTAVIIVACPCVLALSTPFTLSAILAIFDKKGFYVKNTDAVEQLAACNSIIFDKTGTLTSTDQAAVHYTGRKLHPSETDYLASLLRQSSHPLSRQILHFFQIEGSQVIESFKETPGVGIEGKVNGVDVALGNKWLLPEGLEAPSNGVHVLIAGHYAGTFSVTQSWRSGLMELMRKLNESFRLYVLSGDTAKDKNLVQDVFPAHTPVLFEQSPHQKLAYIKNKQEEGEIVMMLGDGLNDAGALKQSDFGIAVTDHVNNFTPGCDAILKGSSLKELPRFHQLSKDGLSVIRISFLIAVFYNTVGLFYAVQGTLYPLLAAILMPISTITIISFTTLATRYFARKNQLL